MKARTRADTTGRPRRQILGLALLSLLSASCVRGCTSSRPPIHLVPNMDQQPKYKAQSESAFFYDGGAMRPPVEGTVARGEIVENQALATGRDAAGNFIDSPIPVGEALLLRGADRFQIYCLPCHGERGDGNGVLFDYGVPIPDFREDRIRSQKDGEIFDTVTNGKGLMQGYRYPLPAHDRWAVIAYLRRLQNDQEGQ